MSTPSKTESFFKAASTLAFFGILSRVIGLLRDRILASHFGASQTLDVYYSAFRIPDFIFNLIVTGAMASALIPIFIQSHKQSKQEAWDLISNFLNIALLAVAGLSALLFIFAPLIVPIIAPGFSHDQLLASIQLTRLMLLSPILFTISTVVGAVLQSLKRFLAYALAPIFYNLGIIGGAIYLEPRFGLMGLGLGVVIGALLHLLVQLPAFLSSGFQWRSRVKLRDPGFIRILKLMIPRTIALASGQINLVVLNAIASTIAVGSIAIINFANNLWIVPVSILGIALPTAVFPSLSGLSADNDRAHFLATFNHVFRNIVFLGVPASVSFFIFREPIVRAVLGVGHFQVSDIHLTAGVLGLFALGVVPYSLEQLVARGFYALHNTIIPVIASIFGDIINVTLSILFVHRYSNYLLSGFLFKIVPVHTETASKILGLALAFSIANIVNFIAVWLQFEHFLRSSQRITMTMFFFKIVGITALSTLGFYIIRSSLPVFSDSVMGNISTLTIDLLIFGLYFIVFSALFRVKELNSLLRRQA